MPNHSEYLRSILRAMMTPVLRKTVEIVLKWEPTGLYTTGIVWGNLLRIEMLVQIESRFCRHEMSRYDPEYI